MSKHLNISPKAKKIINIVVDVVCGVILVFALILAISLIDSKAKNYDGYTAVFGKAYLAVSSDSMAKDCETGEVKADNFDKGDLIAVKILKDKKAQSVLKVGDVITFKTNQVTESKDKWVLNTHRIVEISEYNGGYIFTTKGDNNPSNDAYNVYTPEVVGVYTGKAGGVGNFMLFMGSSWGFFTFVVVPTLIIVLYCVVNLILVISKEKKVQTVAAAQEKEDERERIRQELLAEMSGQKGETGEQPAEPESVQSDAPAEVDGENDAVKQDENDEN